VDAEFTQTRLSAAEMLHSLPIWETAVRSARRPVDRLSRDLHA